ncbi:hypothetical protein BJ138DRAFT_1237321 [Hygrophoropsis aurantiaca]|uniref:Uncharacterized protein n=1 Tax=Hygrophoropsis aurantiaca TaxID=72124 RepID=A0ACB7ZTG7_9AGAM|nr:hypothetical protein BJ138DRAFT_1237321 [Hygrophoropsis aurantiaca]
MKVMTCVPVVERPRVNSAKSLREDAAEALRVARQKKRTRHSDVGASKDRGIPVIPVSAPVEAPEPSAWDLLMRLDSWQRPGLSVTEFKKLFRSCTCGLVMTERVFESHECARVVQPGEEGSLVDLTVEQVDSEFELE